MSGAADVDDSLYPIAKLIDELRHDDVQCRLYSIRSLGTIATALGPERTRDELVPFLQEIIDDEDEVLVALCEQFSEGIDWVGGPAYAYSLLGPLEEICNVEEVTVRNKATESLRAVVAHMSPDHVARHACALIQRLEQHEWPTSRISACNIFSAVLPRVSPSKQEDLLKLYCRLCEDDAPTVRRQAAQVLGEVAAIVQESMIPEVLEVFEKLSLDDQDSVRILAINNCIALGNLPRRGVPGAHAQILPVVKACSEDKKSWRVRYMMADKVEDLCKIFADVSSPEEERVEMLFLKLLSDQEEEVRTIAAARICEVAAVNKTPEFLEKLMQAIGKMVHPRETSAHVRASLAGSFLRLTQVVGAKLIGDHLITTFLALLKDESPEVRVKLIGTLDGLTSVVEIDTLSQSLLPAIKDLGSDRQWRVRLAILDCMPSLAKYLGNDKFTSELSGLFLPWLTDPVFSVRDAASENFRKLALSLGTEWTEAHIVPQLQALLAHTNYLYRISSMLCVSRLSEAVSPSFIEEQLVPMVVRLCGDPVPNVRFNATKTIQAMHRTCPAVNTATRECLERLQRDQDPDVVCFAQRAAADMIGGGAAKI